MIGLLLSHIGQVGILEGGKILSDYHLVSVKTSVGIAGIRQKPQTDLKPLRIFDNGTVLLVQKQQNEKNWVQVISAIDKMALSVLNPSVWIHESQILKEGKIGYIISSDGFANGRSEPSSDGNVVRKLLTGSLVQINSEKDDWYWIDRFATPDKGVQGYIPKEYVVGLNTSAHPLLTVPYRSQLDNSYDPTGTCGITSASMLFAFWGKEIRADQLYQVYGKETGQSPETLANLYKTVLGSRAQVTKTYNGTFDEIKSLIRLGQPVVTHGYFTKPGHIVVVIGYTPMGFVVHDPYGNWLGGYEYDTSVSGKGLTYSYSDLRTVMSHDGDVWYSSVRM